MIHLLQRAFTGPPGVAFNEAAAELLSGAQKQFKPLL